MGQGAKSFVPGECLFGCVAWIFTQHDCNMTVTRTATQPRNAVIYRVNLPCSMVKGVSNLLERELALARAKNTDCMVKNSVGWPCCSACCSRVAVKAHATQQGSP